MPSTLAAVSKPPSSVPVPRPVKKTGRPDRAEPAPAPLPPIGSAIPVTGTIPFGVGAPLAAADEQITVLLEPAPRRPVFGTRLYNLDSTTLSLSDSGVRAITKVLATKKVSAVRRAPTIHPLTTTVH
jgi:hypothetical protein